MADNFRKNIEEALVIAQQKKQKHLMRRSLKTLKLQQKLFRVRNYRQTKGISPREAAEIYTNASEFANEAVVRKLANVSEIHFGENR
jgi:valyl-tRNA synthetase